ncbi:MAG: hypothetical protein NT049_08095 [Planctomycetota bacterium]|nr:hypothetical protein [Planctomycetota bacterium]
MRLMAMIGISMTLAALAAAEESVTLKLAAGDGAILMTEADNQKESVAWVGRTIEVRLEGDKPRTGWEDGTEKGALEFLGMEMKPKEGAADKAIGTYTFRYKCAKEGSTFLRIVYVFPGGPEVKERDATAKVKEFKAIVEVKAPAAPAAPAPAEPKADAPGTQTVGGRVVADNATSKFIGPESDWPKCKVALRDIQGLMGGQDVYLDGSGDCIVRIAAKGNEKRFSLKLAQEEVAAVRRMCIRSDLADMKIKERPGVPDEAHPEISLTSAAGETRKVAKWANDKVPAFDKVYAVLVGISKRTAELKPTYEGKYDPAWQAEKK